MKIPAHRTKGRSLKTTPSINWYGRLIAKWTTYNKNQRLDGEPEVSFVHFCRCRGIDLSGKQFVDINAHIDLLNSAICLKY